MNKIKDYLKEYSYLRSIQSLLYWDMETMMPKGSIEDRAQRLSYLQGKIHGHITARKYEALLSDAKKMKLKPLEKKILKELEWDHRLMKALPKQHVEELSLVQSRATHVWSQAKKANDWKSFEPHLQKLIELKRKETTYFNEKKPYDALLRLHDKEFNSEQISKLFSELRKGLINLSGKVKEQSHFTKVKDLKGPFPIDQQKLLSEEVARAFGLPAENSRLDISSHPFSINISPLDQRITTRYDLNHLDSLSSTMHEVGHALYELNLPREWEGTPMQEAVSLSVHESQSRFWENVIGRSRGFCHYIHPLMSKHFAKSLKGVSEEQLYYYFNKSVPGLIRVESSELYYNFHIIIRFEIEEMIFNQKLNAKDLPSLWASKYREYLGLKVPDHKHGVLQDSHWAGGAFGYFPTYTLGNLISGSLYQKVKKEIPSLEKQISNGNFKPTLEWLVKNIHQKGRSITSKDLVGELKISDYLRYLEQKFKE